MFRIGNVEGTQRVPAQKIMETAGSIRDAIGKPHRFGSGQTMTVAVLYDWRRADERGLLDKEATVGVLRFRWAEQELKAVTS